MVAYTPAYLLPYAEGTDRPCDFDQVSCSFAQAVESQLGALDAVVKRTYTTVPMAWVRTQTTLLVTQNATQNTLVVPPFDTTVVDTDNMVDLSDFSGGFKTTRAGLYLIWAYVRSSATTVIGPDTNTFFEFYVEPVTALSNIWPPRLQFAQVTLGQFQRQTVMNVVPLPAGTTLGMRIEPLGLAGDVMTFTEIDLAGIWVGDLP